MSDEAEILAHIAEKLDAINNSIWGANKETTKANEELIKEIRELKDIMKSK